MIKVYRGLLCKASNGESDDLVGLLQECGTHTDILAELIQGDTNGPLLHCGSAACP